MAAAGAEEEDERATRQGRRRRAAGRPAGARPGRPDTLRRGDRPPSAPRTCALAAAVAVAAPEETAEEAERSTAACGRGDTRRGRTAAEASGCGGCTASQRSHLSPRNPREICQGILRQRPKRKRCYDFCNLFRGGESETLKGGQELTSHDSAANLAIGLDKSTKWRPELPLANSVLVSFYPFCSWSDRCGRRERITEKWKNFSRLQERDDAPPICISAGNSNFYGKNLLLGLIQGINKKEGEN